MVIVFFFVFYTLFFYVLYTANFCIVSCGQSIRLSIYSSDRTLRTYCIFVSAFVSSDFLGFLSIIPLKLSSFLIHDSRRRDRAKELGCPMFVSTRIPRFRAPFFSLSLSPPAPRDFTLAALKLAVVRITSNVHCITTLNISSKVTATD